ncbi:MAG TPA: FAD-dependent oxidoreductase [Labilithrix sp.]|nr:FAD-dependent oxidoreductase [Labilithrix sp.]
MRLTRLTAFVDLRTVGLFFVASSLLPLAAGCAPAGVEEGQATSEALSFPNKPADTAARKHCDVVIAGGSTAAIAAAVAAADVGAKTCLIEPTEWIGGQLTASGVSAVDWAWHRVGSLDVGAAGKARENVTPSLFAMMSTTGNPGGCWVSKNCYEPKTLLSGPLGALAGRYTSTGQLIVLKNTVIKRVVVEREQITRLVAVQRTPKAGVGWGGYDHLPSQDLADWYDERASARYDKQTIELASGYDRPAVFIDATDWGELLALSGAGYVQGVESREGATEADEGCGQSIVFPFVEKLNASVTADRVVPEATARSKQFYSLSPGPSESLASKWDSVFRYRRVRGTAPSAQPGDLSLQNWNPGNDYPFGYLFMSRSATAAQRADWRGGVDLEVMAGAERHAYGWHSYFKAQGGEPGARVTLDASVLGTGHGLSKLPYIRDTRRSIGLDGFMLTSRDLRGPASQVTGTAFPDRIALGAYAMDVHGISGCRYPSYIAEAGHETLPFFIPFRALTNRDVKNLLVAGKTMAQSFLANAATRLQPIEWSSGTAAGAAAAHMARWGLSSRGALDAIADIQSVVKVRTPIDWTVEGVRYPE